MERMELVHKSMDDIVFEDKNKLYGAYLLRKLYSRNILVAFFATAATFAAILFTFFYFSTKEKEEIVKIVEVKNELIELPPIMPDVELPPPPPPPKIEMPEIKTVKFVPPKVVPDEQIQVEEIPPSIEELAEAAISDVTQDGDSIADNGVPNIEGVLGGTGDVEVKEPLIIRSVGATFPGGLEAFNRCIQDKIQYSRLAIMNEVEGTVHVSFKVTAEGKVTNVRVLKGIFKDLDEQAIKAVQECEGWTPGIQNGVRVPMGMQIPVRFTLPDRY
ncbi:MAG: energy transducer TonB [Cytophagaceae bacterium]